MPSEDVGTWPLQPLDRQAVRSEATPPAFRISWDRSWKRDFHQDALLCVPTSRRGTLVKSVVKVSRQDTKRQKPQQNRSMPLNVFSPCLRLSRRVKDPFLRLSGTIIPPRLGRLTSHAIRPVPPQLSLTTPIFPWRDIARCTVPDLN